jgi:putative phage-type endonuclease
MEGAQQRSAEWHTARRGKLTASNLGAALGQVGYTSRVQALRRALGTDTFVGNVATDHGTKNEANAILDYQILSGNVVDATGLWIHPDYPWLAGSPDGFVGSEGMVEVKCPFYRRKNGQRLHSSVPGHYWMQINALLQITGRKWCDYICWCEDGMVIYRVYPDPDTFDYLLSFYSHFYTAICTQADKPPPLKSQTKREIEKRLAFAVQRTVDMQHWSYAYRGPNLSSSDTLDSDDDDEDAPDDGRAKRQRLPIVPAVAQFPNVDEATAKARVSASREDFPDAGSCCPLRV